MILASVDKLALEDLDFMGLELCKREGTGITLKKFEIFFKVQYLPNLFALLNVT